MPPTQQNVVQATLRLVHTVLGRVHRVLRVSIVLECLRINDTLRKLAANDESISHDVPLTLRSEKEQQFSQIVDESGYLHPLRFAVSPNGFGGLQQMFDLRDGRLGKTRKSKS